MMSSSLLRPRVDACVFRFLKSRPFDRKEFVETGAQVLLAPKTAREVALRVLAEVPASECEEAARCGNYPSPWRYSLGRTQCDGNCTRAIRALPRLRSRRRRETARSSFGAGQSVTHQERPAHRRCLGRPRAYKVAQPRHCLSVGRRVHSRKRTREIKLPGWIALVGR